MIDNVYQMHCLLQQTAQKAVNHFLVKYGERLIDEISKNLKSKGLKGYSQMSLRNCRAFYRTYPQIQQSITVTVLTWFSIIAF
jgi:hypothetical protein